MKTREQRQQLEQQLLDYSLTDPEWDDRFRGFNPELDMDLYRAAMYQLAYAQLPEAPPSPEESMRCTETKAALYAALQTLTPHEHDVLVEHFGLYSESPRTLDAIGAWLGRNGRRHNGKRTPLSRERVRAIEAKALRKLQHPTRRTRLEAAWHDAPL
jgi:hypothetical protein